MARRYLHRIPVALFLSPQFLVWIVGAGILNEKLWREDLGFHVAWNVSSQQPILARTYVIGFPLWAGLVNASQADTIAATLAKKDLLSDVGLRSTSADDPRYSNANEIIPYLRWRVLPLQSTV